MKRTIMQTLIWKHSMGYLTSILQGCQSQEKKKRVKKLSQTKVDWGHTATACSVVSWIGPQETKKALTGKNKEPI